MRKDVKLGFAIGGVLLAVLIVYVLVVPGSDKPIPAQSKGAEPENVLDGTGIAGGGAARDAQSPPATAPIAGTGTPPNGTDADVFAQRGGAAQPKPEPRWDKLLDGEVPMIAAVGGSVSPIGGGAVRADEIASKRALRDGVIPPTGAGQSPSTQALNPERGATPATSRTHVIREGETLSTISATAYGSANLYPHILKANPGLDPAKLKIGQTINLPDIAQAKNDGIANAATAGARVTVDSNTEYKVAPGDSLYKISVKLYGKSDFSTKIYDLNKAAIGADPAKLKVGSVLKLPQAPTTVGR